MYKDPARATAQIAVVAKEDRGRSGLPPDGPIAVKSTQSEIHQKKMLYLIYAAASLAAASFGTASLFTMLLPPNGARSKRESSGR
jgi:hypothetical protein